MAKKYQSNNQNFEVTSKVLVANKQVRKTGLSNIYSNFEMKKEPTINHN